MAEGKRYNLAYRRQREGRTNYKARLGLLKSGVARLVIRRTNKYFVAQVATYSAQGDLISVSAHSSELKAYGWNAGAGNLPAAYLTGYLVGMRIAQAGIPGVIADFGLQNVAHKGNLTAILKGVIDAGVDLPANEETLPDEARIKGEHIKSFASSSQGAQFKQTKSAAENLPALFSKVKQAISANPNSAKTKSKSK